jgi:hypothetical protein
MSRRGLGWAIVAGLCSCVLAGPPALAVTYLDDPLVPGPGFMGVKKRNMDELRIRVAELANGAGYTPPMAWTDPAIVTGGTRIKATHINEIRRAVENILAAYAGRQGIPYNPVQWSPSIDGNTVPVGRPVRASHFLQPRILMNSLYNAACGNGRCDGGIVGGVPVGENVCTCNADCDPCPLCVPPLPDCDATVSICPNGVCQAPYETPFTCPGDCRAVAVCGNNACEAQESPCNCPVDCAGVCVMPPPPPPAPCNSDGDCDAGEDPCTCLLDNCRGPCCGNGACESGLGFGRGESNNNCPADCGPGVCATGTIGCCGNGDCEPGAGENSCNCYLDCRSSCCGNGWCESSTEPGMPGPKETAASCAGDCSNPGNCRAQCLAAPGGGYPWGGACASSQVCRFMGVALDAGANNICRDHAQPPYGLGAMDCCCFLGPYCGDARCDPGENCGTCPNDCLKACGNGCCEAGPPGPAETCFNCPQDCNTCGDTCCVAPENNTASAFYCCKDCGTTTDGRCCWDDTTSPPAETTVGCAIPRYPGSIGTAECIPDTCPNGCCEPKAGENRCNCGDCYSQPGPCNCQILGGWPPDPPGNGGACAGAESPCNCPDCLPNNADGCCLGGIETCATEPACC